MNNHKGGDHLCNLAKRHGTTQVLRREQYPATDRCYQEIAMRHHGDTHDLEAQISPPSDHHVERFGHLSMWCGLDMIPQIGHAPLAEVAANRSELRFSRVLVRDCPDHAAPDYGHPDGQ
nr:hypothetical protein [uncultured Rhodopila sp.]